MVPDHEQPTGPRQGGSYDSPNLADPDLPRTAKVRRKALRTGWTTGTCSSAAAKAATLALASRQEQRRVTVPLPSGERVSFDVDSSAVDPDGGYADAVVVKDAGDDPDVTHGAHLSARVSWLGPAQAPPSPPAAVTVADSRVFILGGEGVGTVTKPGLGLEVGGPAINGTPRQMITMAVREAEPERPVVVVISVPGGDRMARKTTNGRLGIVGGISILGTTGIVRPFSTASWRASVEQAISVGAAQGETTVVLCTGGRTERGARALLPHLPEVCFVEVGDFTGAALTRMVEHGIDSCVFVGMAGKLTKLASGVVMTHYTRSRVDIGQLADITRQLGSTPELLDLATRVAAANTGRHAYELWEQAGVLRAAGDELCSRAASVLERFTDGRVSADVAMVDFSGARVIAGTREEWIA